LIACPVLGWRYASKALEAGKAFLTAAGMEAREGSPVIMQSPPQ